jgi:hypothetical protein
MPAAGAGQVALLVMWLIVVQASTPLSLTDLTRTACLRHW